MQTTKVTNLVNHKKMENEKQNGEEEQGKLTWDSNRECITKKWKREEKNESLCLKNFEIREGLMGEKWR